MTNSVEAPEYPETPKRSTGSRRSAMSVNATTPAVNRTAKTMPPLEDAKLEARRAWLYNTLHHKSATMDFSTFLGELGLPLVDDPFEEDHPRLFQTLAECAPAYNERNMKQAYKALTREPIESNVFSGAEFFQEKDEAALTAYFKELVFLMCLGVAKQNAKNAREGVSEKSVPELIYMLSDHQTSQVAGGARHKMDLAFTYSKKPTHIDNVHIVVEAKREATAGDIGEKTLKQIADYQHSIWKAQRTRTFIPVLFLHGTRLDLIVFTRSYSYRIKLGHICHNPKGVTDDGVDAVRLTMVRLYYLLTLPTESFGHVCNVRYGRQHLRFVRHLDNGSVLATAKPVRNRTTDSVSLFNYNKRYIHPRGRLAHVFTTPYKGEPAILKLSWTPIDRMPESAVYDILKEAEVDGIPRVLDCGLLKESFFGYRLEYLILEDCGVPVDDYLKSKYRGCLDSDELYKDVVGIVRTTLRCLVQARVQGNIFHRDISVGNIMVGSSGKVKVIDWGYANVVDDCSMDNSDADTVARKGRLAATSSKWKYRNDVVLQNEEKHNPLTGTPLFMSIPVLAGAKVRGLVDDIESLFYVILCVLAELQTNKDDVALGFKDHDNMTQAIVRAGCLSNEEIFLRFFGVSSCSVKLRRLFCDFRQFLFMSSGTFIASNLIADPNTERGIDVGLLLPYVDKDTSGLLAYKEVLTPRKSGKQIASIRPPGQSCNSDLAQCDSSDSEVASGSNAKTASTGDICLSRIRMDSESYADSPSAKARGKGPAKARGKRSAPLEAAEGSDEDQAGHMLKMPRH
ncbi:hypothetical protein GGI04_004703 [Coemansia thaxteri]|nr:hypothetical protein GGI04_004703 [Coemansia thaxteri]